MTFYPFFINLDFAGFQDEATPITPVRRVDLGYIGEVDVEVSHFDDWKLVGDWVRSFQKYGKLVPVGFNLRNLVWPAFTANLAKAGESIPGMFMPMEKKWSNLDMVDLQQLIVQGGYSDWKPSLQQACKFFDVQFYPTNPIASMYDLYKIYQKVS